MRHGERRLPGLEQIVADDQMPLQHAEAEQEIRVIGRGAGRPMRTAARKSTRNEGTGKQAPAPASIRPSTPPTATESQFGDNSRASVNASRFAIANCDRAEAQLDADVSGIYGTDTITLPVAWLAWIATSDLRLAVYALRWFYGITRYLHLAGMACFVGMVVIVDLRGLGLFPPASLDPIRPRLLAVLNRSFWLTIATGMLLFLRDPLGVGLHTMFLPKLLLVIAGYAHARCIRRIPVVRRSSRLRKPGAAASLAIWLLVIGASTWNHVERPVLVGQALRLHNVGK